MLRREQLLQMPGGRAVAARVEHACEQLLGGLLGLDVQQLLLLAAQHQPRLQLQQSGDQHDELGRCLEIELAALLEMVEVCEHHVGERELQQVDLFAQDQRQQQVEGPAEDVQVEIEGGEAHRLTVPAAPDGVPATRTARRRPHALAHVRERIGGDRARALGAGGEHSSRAASSARAPRSAPAPGAR